jgi:hypothetical protein
VFLLNLSPLEFLAIFGAVSAFVVTLYLLSRSRKRQRVATLRFWTQAQAPVVSKQRRRIQQPLSLILQLLSIALLLLALGQLQWGSRDNSARDHVLLLDTSSWMSARSGTNRSLLDEAKDRARAYVRALPASDRIMVVRADALPSPATGMDKDRGAIEKAIYESRPGAAALDLQQAFAFSEQVRRLYAKRAGDVVYIGPGRISEQGVPVQTPIGLRVIPVDTGAIDNVGLTRIGLRRSPADPEVWDVFVSARNYGSTVRSTPLAVQFGGAPIANRLLMLAPGKIEEFSFRFRTKAAGWVEARLLTRDSIAEDNRALLEIPALKTIKVAVYTDDPDTLRPALQAHPQIEPAFYPTAAYRPDVNASVVVLDRFAPRLLPKSPSIWLEPPEPAPFRVRTKVTDAKIVRWRADHELAAGLRSQDSRVPEAQVYATSAGDISVAETDTGPIVLARPSMRAVVMGFHPGRSDLRYDLMTPLLLANVFRWFEPDVFRAYDLHGGSAGSVSTTLDADVDPATVKVIGEHGELPFTVQGQAIRFFAGVPQTVRVISSGREQVHSLSLPEVAPTAWEPPRSAFRGIPGGIQQAISRDLWQYLAVLGGISLLVEWLLYGRARQRLTVQSSTPATDVMMRQAS